MSIRPSARLFQASRSIFRQPITLRQPLLRRNVATATETPVVEQSKFQKLWNSPVGPKTVHFWAPIMKWGVVLAGVSDFFRPASALSLNTNAALVATGAIWTRWCFVIRPQNYFLAAINFLLFLVGSVQVGRILSYRNSPEGKKAAEEAGKVAEQAGDAVKGAVRDAKGAVEKVVKA